MLRYALILLLFISAGCAEPNAPSPPPSNSDLVPLAVGNEWVYARAKFVRGLEVEQDTVRIRVLAQSAEDEFVILRTSQYATDSLHVRRTSPDRLLLIDSAEHDLLHYASADPFAELLIATTGIIQHTRVYSTLADTTYASSQAVRIREHVELLNNDGSIALRLDFDHLFVPGIGQVAVRFVADINECLRCSLISEFWVYELVSYKAQ